MSDNLLGTAPAETPIETPTQIEGAGKPAFLPEKFWDASRGEIRLEALAKSYTELERKLSGMVARPETEEDRFRLLRLLGLPESPDQYEIDVSHGLFESDPELNRVMFEKGFTAPQVQAVYDIAAEKFVPLVFEIAQEFKADREVERLVSAFGGPQKWQEISRQLLAFGNKNLPPDAMASLSNSFEGVMILYRMMKGQEPGLAALSAAGQDESNPDALKAMMRDPRYWRDKDPSFVGRVTEGFRRLYGE